MHAVNAIGDDGAASLAPSLARMTQLTTLELCGTLLAYAGSCAVSGCLQALAMRRSCCVLRAAAVVRGAVAGGGGFCEGRAEGRRSVQSIRLEKMGQRRWHRVS
jgi:hypothetical protein